MLGMSLDKAKSNFFDTPKVKKALDEVTREKLSRLGAFTRRTAQQSIRVRKKPSAPGSPPSGHNQQLLSKNIEFAWDSSARSVVVGPTALNIIYFDGNGQPVKGLVPEVLEEGGEIRVLEVFKRGEWRRADLRSKRRLAGLPTRMRSIFIAARPYMKPAFDKELKELPPNWRDSIRG